MNKRILQMENKRYDKWPTWITVIFACFMVEVFLIVGNLLFALPIGLIATFAFIFVLMGAVSPDNFQFLEQSLHLQLIVFAGVALVNFAWVKWFELRPVVRLGFFKTGVVKDLLKGWAVGMLLFAASFVLSYAFGGMELVKVDFSTPTLFYVLSTIPFWFIQGGTEELLTRGWLLPILAKKINLPVAICISSGLFGFMHLGNDHFTLLSMLSLILSGVLMALYMLKTDNIWGVAALHGAWNFTQGNFFGVAVSGKTTGASLFQFTSKVGSPDWISGGAFGTEGSLFSSIVLAIGIAYLLWELSREKKNIEE